MHGVSSRTSRAQRLATPLNASGTYKFHGAAAVRFGLRARGERSAGTEDLYYLTHRGLAVRSGPNTELVLTVPGRCALELVIRKLA
jgi:hypothetical protein